MNRVAKYNLALCYRRNGKEEEAQKLFQDVTAYRMKICSKFQKTVSRPLERLKKASKEVEGANAMANLIESTNLFRHSQLAKLKAAFPDLEERIGESYDEMIELKVSNTKL